MTNVVKFPKPLPIHPIEFKVMVERDAAEKKTVSGLIIPETIQDKEKYAIQFATVVAVSPFAFSYNDKDQPWPKGLQPQPGDRVLVAKYAGTDIKQGEKTYTILNDKDVLAKIEE